MAELNSSGLVIDRQPEILENLKDNAREDIHPDIVIRDDEALGQQFTILAQKLSELQELTEAVNNNFNPYKAEGTNLDDIGTLKDLPRQAAGKSFTNTQYFTEANGFIIPSGSILENPLTFDRFVTTSNITLSNLACISVSFSVDQLLNSTDYGININDTAFTYTSDTDATELEIITGLKASVDATSPTNYSATLDTDNNYLIITSADTTNIKVTFEAYLSIESVTGKGSTQAQNFGAISAPSNSVNKMITSTSVVTNNPISYVLGREKESDEDYRNRLLSTNNVAGKATVEAIQDDVSLVSNVTSVKVIENITDTTDLDGRPEHSFETIVQGGTDADVASAIWTSKPAGIESHGNTTIATQDKYGNPQSVKATRPVSINLAYEVDYTTHSETTFPTNGEELIQQKIAEITNSKNLGEDIIPVTMFGDVISAVGYLESITIRVQQITNQGDTPIPANWQTNKLSISDSEKASTIVSDVVVQEI